MVDLEKGNEQNWVVSCPGAEALLSFLLKDLAGEQRLKESAEDVLFHGILSMHLLESRLKDRLVT